MGLDGVEIVVDVRCRLGDYRCWKMTACKELLAIRRQATAGHSNALKIEMVL